MKTNDSVKNLRRPFIRTFFKNNRLNLGVVLIVTIFFSMATIVLSWVLQQIMDAIAGEPGAWSLSAIAWFVLGFIAVCGILALENTFFKPKFMAKAMLQYRSYAFESLLKKDLASFSEEKTSHYLSALSNDANEIEKNYLGALPELVENAVWFIGAITLMLWYSPFMTLIALIVSLLPMAVSLLAGNRVANAEKAVSTQNTHLMGFLKDVLSGFSIVKSFKSEKEVNGIFRKTAVETEETKCSRNRIAMTMENLGSMSGMTAQMLVFLAGAWLARSGKEITAGMVMAFVNLIGVAMMPIGKVPTLLAQRKAALALIDKLASSLNENVQEPGNLLTAKMKETIEMKDVSFSYVKDQPVLKHVNAVFEAGKAYAIVGGSGSGKSTLLHLLIGNHGNYDGSVLYDGREIRTLRTASLYDVVSLVQQNVFVFDSTIAQNITINNLLESIPKHLEETKVKLATVEHQLETAKIEVQKPFEKEAELAEKLDRLSALNALLNMDEKGDEGIGMDDDIEQGETNRVADKPAGRTSLKEKLEVMKAKVATAGRTEQTVQKGVEKAEVL